MKQSIKKTLTSDSRVMLLWGVTTLCVVFAAAYVFRHKAFLSSHVHFDPNRLRQIEPNEAELNAYLAEDQNMMEAIRADNLLAKAPPKSNPVTDVDIIGQEVLVNGKLYKVGDKISDAEIVAITAQSVTVKWNGTSTTFSPINGQDQGGGSSGSGQGPGASNRRSQPSGASSRPGRNVARGEGGRARMAPPTPEEIQRLGRMSPEERRAFMEARRSSRGR